MHSEERTKLWLKDLFIGIRISIGILIGFGLTGLLAVTVSGTFNTFASNSIVKSSEVNANFATLKTAIEGVVSSQWTTSGSNIGYTAGSVGIGTTSPQTTLDVSSTGNSFLTLTRTNKSSGSGEFAINVESNSQTSIMYDSANSIVFGTSTDPSSQAAYTERMRINQLGNVGIAVTNPTNPLQMASGAFVSSGGTWTNASSKFLKENILDLEARDALSAFNKLEPKRYNYKNEKEEEYLGFLAEDVPDLVATKDRKSLSAMDISALTVKVVQEQQKEFSRVKAENTELRKEITMLRSTLEERLRAVENKKLARK